MDNFYYSNHCKHSKKIIQHLVKNSLTDKLNFICLDKRKIDPKTQQIYAILDNGQSVGLPPHINSVPCLLLVKQNYRVVNGADEIIEYFKPYCKAETEKATGAVGEPMGFSLSSLGEVVSENYTFYNMTPEELSAKGVRNSSHLGGSALNMYNATTSIQTPPNTYKSERMRGGDEFEAIREERARM